MTPATVTLAPNPFPGLRPYSRERELFGRERDLILFRDRLYSARTTLLFAASGVGKSSFLQAKVVPELEASHFVVMHARWGAREPLEALRDSWLKGLSARLAAQHTERERWLAGVAADEAAIRAALDELWTKRTPLEFAQHFAALDTVLVLDQFEEPLNSLVSDPGVDRLIEALSALINDTQLPLRVVFSMRQEFLAELSLFENRIPDLFANYYNLRHPTPEQAATIISKTALTGGAKFDGLGVARLVQDLLLVGGLQGVGAKSGETQPLRFVVPPVLQIVCSRLWQRDAARLTSGALTFAQMYERGEALRVVQGFVEELIAKLDDEQQLLLSKALDFLVSRQGGKVAYEVGVLAQHLASDRDALDAALDKLATEPDRVLRRIDRADGTRWYELYHDAYAGALTAWKATFDEALAARELARIEAEKKKSNRQARVGCVFAVLFLGALALTITAWDAREPRAALAGAGDDYAKARAAYDELGGNWIKNLFGIFDADEHLARFWDRRADEAALRGPREQALVYALEALATKDTDDRRKRVNEIIGSELDDIVATTRTSDPIVALSRDGERYATCARGSASIGRVARGDQPLVATAQPTGFFASGVEAREAKLSDDGKTLWVLGVRAREANMYEQKAVQSAGTAWGLWRQTLHEAEPGDATASYWVPDTARSWSDSEQFAGGAPRAWQISANGAAAVAIWLGKEGEHARAFDDAGAHELGITLVAAAELDGALSVALRPDGSAAAFVRRGNTLVERPLGGGADSRRLMQVESTPAGLCYSPDGRWLAVATESGALSLIDTSSQEPAVRAVSPQGVVLGITFAPESDRLIARTSSGFEVWETRSGTPDGVARLFETAALAPAPDATLVTCAVPAGDRSVLTRWAGFPVAPHGSRWLPVANDRTPLFAASALQLIVAVDATTLVRLSAKAEPARQPWLLGPVGVTLSPDGKRAWVRDGLRYALVDIESGAALDGIHELQDDGVMVTFDFDAGGARAFAAVNDVVRELPEGRVVDTGRIRGIARVFAVRGGDELLLEIDDEQSVGRELTCISTRGGGQSRSFAAGGTVRRTIVDAARTHAAVLCDDENDKQSVRAWDLASGEVAWNLAADGVMALALSDGGTKLALLSKRALLTTLELHERGNPVPIKLPGIELPGSPLGMAFTPDASTVVIRTADAVLRIAPESFEPDSADTKFELRYLSRTAIVSEPVPNWFDADDAKGERPRVLVVDELGRVVLERVRFDRSDLAPIEGDPNVLRGDWRRRLALEIDGNGRATAPSTSGSGGGSY